MNKTEHPKSTDKNPKFALNHSIPVFSRKPNFIQKPNVECILPLKLTPSPYTKQKSSPIPKQNIHFSLIETNQEKPECLENNFNPFLQNSQDNLTNSNLCDSNLKPSLRTRRSSSSSVAGDSSNKPRVKFKEEPEVLMVENWKDDNLSSQKRLLKAYSKGAECNIF